ncbi:hypothetical protein [Corynebacterium durum]|uniref:hypothetical protein n=1 Tax=Corynebacterium durum TaxID=61592 RepID=UPI004025EB5D
MTVNFYGLGELPGASIIAAADIVAGETGDLRQLPILPARGVDVVGLTTGILPGINVDAGPRSWVLSTRPQLRTRRIWDRVEADLDQCEQAWGTRIDAVKIQLAGPWTLSASIELSNGHRALTDTGALRDLTESLIAGIQDYSADVRARFDTEVYVQLDEPLLGQVRDGSLPGTSQFDEIPSINDVDLGERLAGVTERAEVRYLNQTGYPPLWKVAQVAGVETCQVTLDTVRGSEQYDGMGHALAAGMRVGLGMTRAGDDRDPRHLAVDVARMWDELGLDRTLLTHAVDVHPCGGLANCTLLDAAAALRTARTVADMLDKDAGDL